MRKSRMRLALAGALLLSVPILPAGCGDEPTDGAGPAVSTTAPASPTTPPVDRGGQAGEDGQDDQADLPGQAALNIGQVDAACQRALDYYQQNKDRDDPVRSQIVSNQAVSDAASDLSALGAAELIPLVEALRDYAAVGGRLAAAMDSGDIDEQSRRYDESEAIGGRIEAASTDLGAATCARLAGI